MKKTTDPFLIHNDTQLHTTCDVLGGGTAGQYTRNLQRIFHQVILTRNLIFVLNINIAKSEPWAF